MRRRIRFDECDEAEEVCGWLNKIRADQDQMEGKIIQLTHAVDVLAANQRPDEEDKRLQKLANEYAVKPEVKPKPKKKPKKKGSVLVKTLVSIVLVLAIAGLCYAAYVPTDINYDIASNPETLSVYLRDVLGSMASDSYLFNPRSAAPAASEGRVYYDSDTNAWTGYNGSSWQNFDVAGGVNLNGAYDFGGAGSGKTITATDGAVTIQNTEADSASLLSLSYTTGNQTGDALTITIAGGSADGIEIENTGSGVDIEGTGANFTVDKSGNIICVDLTASDDVTFAGTNYDVSFDASADQWIFEDSTVCGFGGAHDAAADITFVYDGSGDDLNITFDDKEIAFGSDGAGGDVYFYFETASHNVLFSEANDEIYSTHVDIQMDDNADLIMGSGNDFVIESDTADTLEILTKLTDGTATINLGVDGAGADLKLFPETSGDYVLFDSDADELYFEDCDLKLNEGAQIEFGDSGNATDWTIDTATAERLTFTPSETDDTSVLHIGTADNTSDVVVYMKTAGETLTMDASADSLTFVGDLALYTVTGTTAPFKVDATGTVAGFAQIFETTDGGIQLNADGADNGDITIDAADILTLTSADIKMHDGATTEIWHIEGSADGSEHIISFTDATADITWTFPDGGTDILAIMGSTLATNYPEVANSVTGGTNQLIFEGSDADTEETVITATDPTADNTFTLPAAFSGNFMIAGTNSEIYSAVVEVTAAQIKDLAANPKELVAAPGAGYGLKLLSLLLVLDNGGTNYDDAAADGNMYVCYVDGAGLKATGSIEGDAFIDCAADFIIAVEPVALAATAATSIDNDALVLDNDGAEYTTGDGTMTVFIEYAVVNLGL